MKPNAVARSMVLSECASPTTPAELARCVEKTFSHLEQVLVGLIGPTGFNTLLERALYLTRSAWSWLNEVLVSTRASLMITRSTDKPDADATAKVTANVTFEGLSPLFERVGVDAGLEGVTALLGNTLRLLSALIGEGLTLQLLSRVWTNLPTMTESG